MIFLFPKVGYVSSKKGMYLGGRHINVVIRKLTSGELRLKYNYQGREVGLGRCVCVCVCENGVVASHHQRAARRPAAAPGKKKTSGA